MKKNKKIELSYYQCIYDSLNRSLAELKSRDSRHFSIDNVKDGLSYLKQQKECLKKIRSLGYKKISLENFIIKSKSIGLKVKLIKSRKVNIKKIFSDLKEVSERPKVPVYNYGKYASVVGLSLLLSTLAPSNNSYVHAMEPNDVYNIETLNNESFLPKNKTLETVKLNEKEINLLKRMSRQKSDYKPINFAKGKMEFIWKGEVLDKYNGRVHGPSGEETYYNLPMDQVVKNMHNWGYEGEYWVREDGVKMFGDYVMLSADLDVHPRGSILETSLGTGIVCDTGTFTELFPRQIDIAVAWEIHKQTDNVDATNENVSIDTQVPTEAVVIDNSVPITEEMIPATDVSNVDALADTQVPTEAISTTDPNNGIAADMQVPVDNTNSPEYTGTQEAMLTLTP